MTTGETIFSITNLEKFDIYGIFLYMNISHMMIQIHLVNTYRDLSHNCKLWNKLGFG